jgi:hypothetical protein
MCHPDLHELILELNSLGMNGRRKPSAAAPSPSIDRRRAYSRRQDVVCLPWPVTVH